MAIVMTKGLSKKYKAKLVLKDISLDLVENEIYGVVGNNGVGKTTLIKCILGLIKPTDGVVKVFNEDSYVMSDNVKKKISIAYDVPMFISNMSALDNLLYFCSSYSISDKDIKKSYEYYSNKLRLEISDQEVGEYSMGMKQKLSIIRALIPNPKFLVLDEPYNGLDYSSKIALSKTLKEYKSKNDVTMLISSHDLRSLEEVATKFIYIEKGIMRAFGNIDEITNVSQMGFYEVIVSSNFIDESIQKINSSNKLKVVSVLDKTLTITKINNSEDEVFSILSELNIPVKEMKKTSRGLEALFEEEEDEYEN